MNVEIYGRPACPYCENAKALCAERGLSHVYYDIQADPARYGEFIVRTRGAKTVPQIFIGEVLIGGFTEFNRAVSDGIVEQMLGGA